MLVASSTVNGGGRGLREGCVAAVLPLLGIGAFGKLKKNNIIKKASSISPPRQGLSWTFLSVSFGGFVKGLRLYSRNRKYEHILKRQIK